ncbi:MAG TPA: hypothetical protein VF929_03185 [Gemmatimonadaceae bacterium]
MLFVPAPSAYRLRAPGYFILGMAVILPLADWFVAISPITTGALLWRFTAIVQLANAASTPLFALLLLYALAYACIDRKALITCAAAAAVIVVLTSIGAVSFPLDAVEFRRRVPAASLSKFQIAALEASLKLVLEVIGSLILLVSVIRTLPKTKIQGSNDPSSSLVMGRLSGAGKAPTAATSVSVGAPGDTVSTEE